MRKVKPYTLFLLLSFYSTVTLAAEPKGGLSCFHLGKKVRTSLEMPPEQLWKNWPGLKGKMLGLQQKINWKNKIIFSKILREQGPTITVNGKAFPVTAILGEGSEAIVFLVSTSTSPVVVKKFFPGVEIMPHLEMLKQSEHPYPRILETDLATRTVLLEFINGITLYEIFESRGIFTREEMAEIVETFTAYTRKAYVAEFNAVLSIDDGRIYQIDPV